MALPFLSKKKMQGKGYVPTDRIRDLASKGFSEPEIIDILRKENFSPEEVDKGLTRALKISVTSEPQQPTSQPEYPLISHRPQEAGQPLQPSLPELPTTMEQLQAERKPQQLEIPETSLPQEYYSSYSTEEYIDYLVSQRVTEFYERLEDISEKYEEMNKNMEEVRKQLSQMEKNFVTQQTGDKKAGEMSDRFMDVSARLGSLEKAFRDTLPNLVESVKTLADLIERLKAEGRTGG